MRVASLLAVASSLALASPANAQSNYRIAPIGGRSQLLGGTGMVYGRDAAASFLNPATAVLVDDRRLTFSVNFYTVSLVYAPRWYEPGPIDRDRFGELEIKDTTMTDLEFTALPSSLCLFFPAGDISAFTVKKDPRKSREARVGMCFATTQRQSFNFAAEGFSSTGASSVTRQAQTLAQSYTRFSAGPTYAFHVSEALAIGASVHASLASHRSLFASAATTYGSSPSPINSTFYTGSRGDSFQLEAIVGATLRFGKQTVGLSVKTPSLHVYGVGGANQQSHYDGSGEATSVISAQGSFVSRSPLRVGIGTGFETTWGQAEFNAFYSTPLDQPYSAELEGTQVDTSGGTVRDRAIKLSLSDPSRGVVNLAAGVEFFFSDRISLLGGLSTDFSAISKGALQRGLFHYNPFRTNVLGASFGLGSHGPGGEILLGGEFSVGWGDRLAVNAYQLPPTMGTTGHGTYQLMFVVAGSTSLRAIQRAVEDVKGIIKEPMKPQNPSVVPPEKLRHDHPPAKPPPTR